MKNNIFKGLFVCGVAIAMAGCSENTWNEDNLDGFEVPSLNTPKRSYIDYTLTSNDYKKIAGMKANVEKATGAGVLSQLEAVGSNGYFTDVIPAREYLGAWLDSIANTPGSAFKSAIANTTARITYETASDMPAPVVGINSAMTYTVTTDDYVKVYDPEAADAESANYADAFSPMCPADKNLPAILATQFPNAVAGDYVYVTYNQSATNPIWGGGTGGDTPKFELSSVLGTAKFGETVDVNGVVTAMARNGIIISDKTGSIFAYLGSSDEPAYKLGTQVTLSGAKISANNNGLQFNKPSITVESTQAVTYPTPIVYDAANAAAWTAKKAEYQALYTAGGNNGSKNGLAVTYVRVVGSLKVSGNYYNVTIGDATYTASLSNLFDSEKALLTNGNTYTIDGYLISAGGTYMNVVVTAIDGKQVFESPAKASAMTAPRSVANVAYETVNAVYTFNGSSWSSPADVYVLTATDYEQMGTSSASEVKALLPKLLAKEFPYAADGDVMYAVYGNNHKCDQLIYNGAEWTINTMTSIIQFVRTEKKNWIFDPTIYLYFSNDYRNDAPSLAFYQSCVRWVWDNINVAKLGINNDIWDNWPVNESNPKFTAPVGYCWGTGKATQEGYSGASAYYCNYDSRPYTIQSRLSAEDYDSFYGGLNDDEIIATLQKRFAEEVAPAAMGVCYPDAKVGTGGIDQEYEITLIQYNKGTKSSSHEVSLRFKVVAPGKFVFVECESWGLKGE